MILLSDKELKEIEDRLNNTSEGKWKAEPVGTMSGAWFFIKDSNNELVFESQCYATNKCLKDGDNDENWYLNPEKWNFEPDGQKVYNDTMFIANAKSDIIKLIAEIRRLKTKKLK